MLVLGVISPVEVLTVNPAVELYVPPVAPVWVTDCKPAFAQNGVPV